MPDIAVIIVNWNSRPDLQHCLSCIYRDPAPKVDFAVYVVDNASSDDSVAIVKSDFPQAHLITNSANLGFGKANNQAIQQAVDSGYRYVYLLNSDAFLYNPSVLDQIVEFGDHNPNVGIFGTKVLNPDGSLQFSCRRFPTLGAGFFRNTLLGRMFPNNKYAADYLMENIDHNQVITVDWVSGCSMVIRADTIRKIGMFDEQFFMYCEDVDICKRTSDAGYIVQYCPYPVVTHKIGASSDKNADKMIWEFHRSWELYDRKHKPGFRPFRRIAVKVGLWLRATVRIMNRHRNQRRVAQHNS